MWLPTRHCNLAPSAALNAAAATPRSPFIIPRCSSAFICGESPRATARRASLPTSIPFPLRAISNLKSTKPTSPGSLGQWVTGYASPYCSSKQYRHIWGLGPRFTRPLPHMCTFSPLSAIVSLPAPDSPSERHASVGYPGCQSSVGRRSSFPARIAHANRPRSIPRTALQTPCADTGCNAPVLIFHPRKT